MSNSLDRMIASLDRLNAGLQVILDHLDGKRLLKGPPKSEQRDEHIKSLVEQHMAQRRRERDMADLADMAEANRRARLLQSQERPLSDVPLHQRGFGVMDEDAPGDGDAV
jgi:hypothetical protein